MLLLLPLIFNVDISLRNVFIIHKLINVYICKFCLIAPIIGGEWLKKKIIYKISTELPEGPFSIVYMHSTVNTEYNNPGITILRWIYEELPSDFKDRLQVLYFVHPGLRSRLLIATLGRFLLSGG